MNDTKFTDGFWQIKAMNVHCQTEIRGLYSRDRHLLPDGTWSPWSAWETTTIAEEDSPSIYLLKVYKAKRVMDEPEPLSGIWEYVYGGGTMQSRYKGDLAQHRSLRNGEWMEWSNPSPYTTVEELAFLTRKSARQVLETLPKPEAGFKDGVYLVRVGNTPFLAELRGKRFRDVRVYLNDHNKNLEWCEWEDAKEDNAFQFLRQGNTKFLSESLKDALFMKEYYSGVFDFRIFSRFQFEVKDGLVVAHRQEDYAGNWVDIGVDATVGQPISSQRMYLEKYHAKRVGDTFESYDKDRPESLLKDDGYSLTTQWFIPETGMIFRVSPDDHNSMEWRSRKESIWKKGKSLKEFLGFRKTDHHTPGQVYVIHP